MKMKKLGYLSLSLVILAAIGLAVNNYRQTQQAKRIKAEQAAISNQTNAAASTIQPTEASDSNILAVVNISGFDCPSCPAIAASAIKNTQGVLDAKITESGEASEILYNSATTNLENIKKSLPDQYQLQLVRQDATKLNSIN